MGKDLPIPLTYVLVDGAGKFIRRHHSDFDGVDPLVGDEIDIAMVKGTVVKRRHVRNAEEGFWSDCLVVWVREHDLSATDADLTL